MAKTTCNCFVAKWLESPCGCQIAGLFIKFSRTMASHLQRKRNGRFETEAHFRPSERNDPVSKEKIAALFKQGRIGRRLSDGTMDLEAYCNDNWAPFWGSVSYKPCLAVDAGMELELPKACQESPRKGGTANSGLEGSCLAPYKKKPKNLKRTWFSSMKAAFFLLQMSEKRGRLKEKLQFFRWQPIRKNCLPFLRSAFRPREGILPSLSGFIRTITFMEKKSCASLSTCCTGSAALSSCFGIRVKFTLKPRSFISFCKNITASMQTHFPLIHQSLTPMNMFGITLRGPWQTAFQKILSTLKNYCNHQYIGFDFHENFYGLALKLPSYHGNS
jgi:hypothetical protein